MFQILPQEHQFATLVTIGVLTFILFVFVNKKYQRSKVLTTKLEEQFRTLGFEILSERPLNFVESIRYGINLSLGNINGIPIEAFLHHTVNQRVFRTRRTDSGNEWELYCEIKRTWSNNIEIDILTKSRLTW